MEMDNEAAVEAAKKAFVERQAQMEQDAKDLEERLSTPIGRDEANKAYADIGMREAQLLLAREQLLGRLNEVDQQLAGCRCAKAEIDCRLAVLPSARQGETAK